MAEVKNLSDFEQDAIAEPILEEIKDEVLWDKAFEKSQDTLAKLAAEAIAEDRGVMQSESEQFLTCRLDKSKYLLYNSLGNYI